MWKFLGMALAALLVMTLVRTAPTASRCKRLVDDLESRKSACPSRQRLYSLRKHDCKDNSEQIKRIREIVNAQFKQCTSKEARTNELAGIPISLNAPVEDQPSELIAEAFDGLRYPFYYACMSETLRDRTAELCGVIHSRISLRMHEVDNGLVSADEAQERYYSYRQIYFELHEPKTHLTKPVQMTEEM